jgi:hypothetical protein
MGAWLTAEERAGREARIEAARAEWVGRTLDYGEFAREVFDVEIDDRDRLILRARAGDEDGYVPELASRWEVGDD